MDGIAYYYISDSGKIKIKILKNRSFVDREIEQIDEKGLTHYYFNITGLPNISNYHDLNKSAEIEKLLINGKASLEVINEKKPEIMKFLGNEFILNKHTVDLKYEIESNNLNYFKEYKNYNITP